MTHKTYRAARCPICDAVVVVWKQHGVPARTLRKLALADQVLTMHPGRLQLRSSPEDLQPKN